MEILNITKREIFKWIEIGIAIEFSLIFLLILYLSELPYYYLAIIPLQILDLKIIVHLLRSPQTSDLVKDIIESTGSFLFKPLQILFWATYSFNFFLTLIPLSLGLIVRCMYRTRPSSDCHSFSSIIFFWTRWTRILFYISVGVKIENYSSIAWVEAFWVVWILLSFLLLVTLGILILLCTSFLAFAEENKDELIATAWLAYTTAGGFLSYGYLFLSIVYVKYLVWPLLVSISYMGMLFILTYLCFNSLLLWWSGYFHSETEVIPEIQPSTERPFASSPRWVTSIRAALKKPPQLLLRLSSTYYKPVIPSKRRRKSLPEQKTVMDEEEPRTHRRSNSSEIHQVLSPAGNDKVVHIFDLDGPVQCCMCYENSCNAVIMDCGHSGICYECSLNVWKNTGMCHMCRTPVSYVLQIKDDTPSESVRVLSTTRAMFSN